VNHAEEKVSIQAHSSSLKTASTALDMVIFWRRKKLNESHVGRWNALKALLRDYRLDTLVREFGGLEHE
jgi:hypothetical protein